MFDLLFIASIIATGVQYIKESCEPTIPAENLANKDLYYKDIMNGVSSKQLTKNVKNGKYKETTVYPEPHKDPKTGQIIIENSLLYREDVKNYGAYQAQQWVKQGKYNLTPDELKNEEKRIEEYFRKLYRFQ